MEKAYAGLCSYYRRFIKDFAKLAEPLRCLDQSGAPFVWGAEQQSAFEELKRRLCSELILVHPNFKSANPFVLDTDASGWAIGAVLSQQQSDGSIKPIAYASRSLNQHEWHYAVTRKELLSAVKFMNHFRYYLMGCRFIIRTDHQALKWLMTSKALYNHLMRWWETITNLDFEIQHRLGRIHGNADSLSQYPYPDQTTSAEVTEEDKQMCNQLGLKVPSGLHRKGGSTEQGVNIVAHSKAVSH